MQGIAQVHSRHNVLELFGGTCLSTAILATRTRKITSVDLHYGYEAGASWRYVWEHNLAVHLGQYKVRRVTPTMVTADACSLPLSDASFDIVIAPDSPRSPERTESDKDLFVRSAREAKRVLIHGGIFIATAPASWVSELHFFDVRVIDTNHLSVGLQYKRCNDPVEIIRCTAT